MDIHPGLCTPYVQKSVRNECKTTPLKNWNQVDGDYIFVLQLGCRNPSPDESNSAESIGLVSMRTEQSVSKKTNLVLFSFYIPHNNLRHNLH